MRAHSGYLAAISSGEDILGVELQSGRMSERLSVDKITSASTLLDKPGNQYIFT